MGWKEDFTFANRALLEEDPKGGCHRFYYSLFNGIKEKLEVSELEHASGQYLKEFVQGSNQSSRGRAIPFTFFYDVEISDAVRLCLVSSIVHQNYLLIKLGRVIRNKPTRGHIQELIPFNKKILTKDLNDLTSAELLSSAFAFVYMGRIVTEYEESIKFTKEDVSLSTYYSHVIYRALMHNDLKEVTLPAFPVLIEFPSRHVVSFKFGYGAPYPVTEFVSLVRACFQEAVSTVSSSKIAPVYHVEMEESFLDEEKLRFQFDKFIQSLTMLPGVLIYSPIKAREQPLPKKVADKIRSARSDTHAVLVLANFVREMRKMKPIRWYKQVLRHFREIPHLDAVISGMENRDHLLRSQKRGKLKEYHISDKGIKKLSKEELSE
ncbi:MAG: hypothetical protein KAX16_04000 [Actinomycetia bacterium]|nr:hypothetical protein [Actinomycetes bacterium]